MYETENTASDILLLLTRTVRFVADHPYASVGIFGAAIGSAVTYKVMTFSSVRSAVNNVFTPKVYEVALGEEDLRHMLMDPSVELRWEMTDASVIVTSEKKERPLLPYIVTKENPN